MKALTTWGSYYVLRENVLGSLEPDKYADFIVLDRDYLSVPEDDIPNIRVLMTVVGGKTMHLLPSLARESGMEPERVPPPEGQNRWQRQWALIRFSSGCGTSLMSARFMLSSRRRKPQAGRLGPHPDQALASGGRVLPPGAASPFGAGSQRWPRWR